MVVESEMSEQASSVSAARKDHICVAVRLRPLSEKEHNRGDREVWQCQGNAVGVIDDTFDAKFVYDHVFPAGFSNQGVYDTVASSIVQSSLDGINGTIFAYGVTSSGKTFTMMGDDECPGIVPHAIAEVYHLIAKLSKRKEFALRLSMLEIYNEVVNDLLSPGNANLRLREDPRKGVVVEGATEERLRSSEHALMVVATGNENRKTSATAFNEGSSRSHTIIRLSIEANERAEYTSPGENGADARVGRTHSYLTMVDLAGSESARAEITKSHRVEGSFINKSLLTLGTVIHKLAEGGAVHIPFRDSKLTRILSNSLTGNGARVAVICTITPATTQAEETHNTLKFASRAKKITIEARRNEIMDQSSLIARYQQELSLLRHQLDVMRREGGGGSAGVHPDASLILTLREKYEEEHMAVVELEQERERLEKRVQELTQSVVDAGLALAAADRRLQNAGLASADDAADEASVLRRQVVALAAELGNQERIIKSLTESGAADVVEGDVAVQVMLAEREYMQLQVEDLTQSNDKMATALERLRDMYAASCGVDPASIDLEAILQGEGTGESQGEINGLSAAGAEGATATSGGNLLRTGKSDQELRERVKKLEEKLTAFFAALARRDEDLSNKTLVQQALSGVNAQKELQLADVTAENNNLKQETARLERRVEQLLGYDIDGMNQSQLSKLVTDLTDAVHRVRTSVQLKKVQLRDDRAAGVHVLTPQQQPASKSGMSMEEMEKAIANLKEYGAARKALAQKSSNVLDGVNSEASTGGRN